MKRRIGRQSFGDKLRENKKSIDFLADMAGKPRLEFKTPIPVKRAAPTPSGNKLESSVNDEIYDAAKRLQHAELWRNNRGVAIYGSQQVRYGVGPNGASDWIGYRRILVTTEMVGSFVAQFVALEAKAPGKDLRPDQRLFLDRVSNDGGCAGVAQSGEDARRILE